MRTGRTRPHYQKQKSQCYAYFRVRKEEVEKIKGGQFTTYDFITDSFYFSHTKKQLAARLLDALKKKPTRFSELAKTLGAGKSTLYLLCLALERSGLIEKNGENGPEYRLSPGFSDALGEYANWWNRWIKN